MAEPPVVVEVEHWIGQAMVVGVGHLVQLEEIEEHLEQYSIEVTEVE
jgi:hypothetical protein